jgi:hypothetical protein
MPTRRELIQAKAIEIIRNSPQGIRYSVLVNKIKESLPDIPTNTIHGTVWNLDTTKFSEVYKPSRGLFRHTLFKDAPIITEERKATSTPQINEENFYQPFADYLVNDLEECTKAKPLGSNIFKDKWGTPDVIGVEKSKPSDIVKHEVVIVSAEIKIDASGLITAFGQACSYKTFSHKTYIVVPRNSSEEDKSRIEALCLIFGIGLIFFDSTNAQNPQFEIRVRPQRHEPDMFYVNKYMKMVEEDLFT